jgi:hypothetical protein
MEVIYRVVIQADGTFAVERTEPGKEAVCERGIQDRS